MEDSSDATMKLVEEETHISPKRIKLEKEDRMSALPDCLLVEILSRLPSTKEAIATCILSKRWTRVWPNVHNLIFKYNDVGYLEYGQRKYSRIDIFSSIDKTLNQCNPQLMLNRFELELTTSHSIQVEAQVNNWIRHAINCDVQELDFKFWIMERETGPDFVLHNFFFNNSCITNLKLSGCIFNPNGAITWKNLKSLYIKFGYLKEDLIENMLSGSPLLETLVLDMCYGFRRLDITSKSVKNLVFYGYEPLGCELVVYKPWENNYDDIIEINAPNILSLTIQSTLMLWKLLLVDVSSLVKAELDYIVDGCIETTHKEAKEDMLKEFLSKLPYVEELKIGKHCFKALARLEVKGFIIPSNVKVSGVDVTSNIYSDSDSFEWLDELGDM